MKKQNLRIPKIVRIILITFFALIFLIVAAFLIYTSDYSHSKAAAKKALESNRVIINKLDNCITFGDSNSDVGFIFYPGGKVEYTAYAPILEQIAFGNVFCVLPEMPFNLAVFNADAALDIMKEYTQIKHWYIGGHSLGGAMAANFAAENNDKFEGVILLASYPTKDLSSGNLHVLSILGRKDQVLNLDKYNKYRLLMPTEFIETIIDGANHAQFGDYGLQKGDGAATITAEEQWKITTDEILKFINKYELSTP
ncbi:MAG: alpha/beta fold hydrolase [Mobilitalea sp.]